MRKGGDRMDLKFEDLYQRFFKDVYLFVLTISKDSNIAEEITQETFFRALKEINNFRGSCSVKSWLCQIAKNLYISQMRKKNSISCDDEEFLFNVVAKTNIEEEYIQKEGALEIYKIVQKIEEPLTIQDVKYYKNLSIKELKDFSLEYKTYETTLDEILKEIVYENKQNHKPFMEDADRVYNVMKDEQILAVGKQHLEDLRAANYQNKYNVWSLEDYIFNLYGDTRVIYRTGKVMIPANGSIEVTFDYEKFTGFKYIEETGYDGLEIMTALGSNLNIQNQSLKVVGLEQSIISEHTTGEELENGKREVDLDEECFEIYVKVPERKANKNKKMNVYGYTTSE